MSILRDEELETREFFEGSEIKVEYQFAKLRVSFAGKL
jgi:hypothetical protein